MHYQHTLEQACLAMTGEDVHVIGPRHGPLGSHADPFRIVGLNQRELARWYIEREHDPDDGSTVYMHVGATDPIADYFLGLARSPDPSEVH